MTSAPYLPLAQGPTHGTGGAKGNLAAFAASRFLRRRGAFAGLLVVSLLVLFGLLRHTLSEFEFDDPDGLPPGADLLAYLPFELSEKNETQGVRLKPVRGLPVECLDAYFAQGEPCYRPQIEPLDVLWTWVNGSDPLLQQAKTKAAERLEQGPPEEQPLTAAKQSRLYRDHDELRHSFRSVLQHFRAYTNRFILFTADFPAPNSYIYGKNVNTTTPPENATASTSESSLDTGSDSPRNATEDALEAIYNTSALPQYRFGQIPQWLNLNQRKSGWKDENVELSIIHHAQIFDPYNSTSFNSLAIESQFAHLDDISENFIYMNDDLFMMGPMTPASFYTSIYGVVLHLQSDLLVPASAPNPRVQGEWKSMGYSNGLLGVRFGVRARPYVVHEAKTASIPLLGEMAAMWPEAFARAAGHPFRETRGGAGDVNALFLHSHFVVERAREALLWAWVVARNGGLDDSWGESEAARAWAELGGEPGSEGIEVQADYRDTLGSARVERFLEMSGHTAPSRTTYVFSSVDGYPYTGLDAKGKSRWPSMARDTEQRELPRCRISYAQCFTVENSTTSASAIFKNIAFENPRCGDCVITELVRASGTVGLSAFLPQPERELPSALGIHDQEEVAHLPIVDEWHKGDFSLRAVMKATRTTNVRAWTLQLLQRYRYVIGSTPSLFERVTSPRQAKAVLGRVDKTPDIALLCLNDDITAERVNAQVTQIMQDWQEQHWKRRAAWERRQS